MKKLLKKFCLCLTATLALSSFTMVPAMATDSVKAAPTSSAVLVNGTSVSFQAYNINGYNYFKLRDLGKALSGSDKQFDVGYDSTSKAVTIITGKAYTAVSGDQSAQAASSSATANPSSSEVLIDGVKGGLTAYLINGSNYFKLRDVAAAIDFNVAFKGGVISIDTSTGYTTDSGNTAANANPLIGAWSFDLGDDYISYLIFKADGSLVQFVGNSVGSYAISGSKMNLTDSTTKETEACNFGFTSANGKTVLTVDAAQLGVMEQDGVTANPTADTIKGLWFSKNDIFSDIGDDCYFYFSGKGDILVGIIDSGTYSVNANTFSDNLTDDGSMETTSFEIKTVNGVDTMIAKDSEGNETILYKD